MVMLEDQARPRRCGHADGKILLPLAEYMDKLNRVLGKRDQLCVLARTDASGDEIFRRVEAISKTDADALLVDGITSVSTLVRVLGSTDKPILFNQIAGGKSPKLSLEELRALGVRLVQYSTPLLFAAQQAMTEALDTLFARDGVLSYDRECGDVGVAECTALLQGDVKPTSRETERFPFLAKRA
jgi:2-methylisocitrate lyase-like PEP mutase family enzyme